MLEEYGTPLAQKQLRPTRLPARLWAWLISSQTGRLPKYCISQVCSSPVASVELSCSENFCNLGSNQSPSLWNIKILWNTETVFLHTVTALNLSLHYALFPSLRLDNIVFWKGSLQNSIMAANRWCTWSWTKLHLLKRHTCTTEGFGLGIQSNQDNSIISPCGQLKASCPNQKSSLKNSRKRNRWPWMRISYFRKKRKIIKNGNHKVKSEEIKYFNFSQM